MIAHLISLPKTVVINFCKWTMESKIPGGVSVLFSSRIWWCIVMYCDVLSSFLFIKLVAFFMLVLIRLFVGGCWIFRGGCGSFLLLVTTPNEVNNCAKATLDGRYWDFVRVWRTNFNKIHFPLTLLAAFSHTFSQIHESQIFFSSVSFFFLCYALCINPLHPRWSNWFWVSLIKILNFHSITARPRVLVAPALVLQIYIVCVTSSPEATPL